MTGKAGDLGVPSLSFASLVVAAARGEIVETAPAFRYETRQGGGICKRCGGATPKIPPKNRVGEAGFEPATTSTQSSCTTGLCDSPQDLGGLASCVPCAYGHGPQARGGAWRDVNATGRSPAASCRVLSLGAEPADGVQWRPRARPEAARSAPATTSTQSSCTTGLCDSPRDLGGLASPAPPRPLPQRPQRGERARQSPWARPERDVQMIPVRFHGAHVDHGRHDREHAP